MAREEVLESYLLGRLSEQDRNALEEHYFECTQCFDELQTLQAVRGELRHGGLEAKAKTTHRFLLWASAAGLAAAVVLAAVVLLWKRPTSLPETTTVATPSPVQPSETPRPREPEPTVQQQPTLEQLARVEPPPYEPPKLRGTADEAAERFQRGMERYRQADYKGAVVELRSAAELDPDAAHVPFFLGVSYLMLGDDRAAIDWFRATITLGDSPYLEDAHWYLAKAYLRMKDLDAAQAQLKELIQLRGSRSVEAGQVLIQLERIKEHSR